MILLTSMCWLHWDKITISNETCMRWSANWNLKSELEGNERAEEGTKRWQKMKN